MDQSKIKEIVAEVVKNTLQRSKKMIPIAISNRHIHLSSVHIERLFGHGYTLHMHKHLSQPNQFAAQETVTLCGPKGEIHHVRVLGPERSQTQIEVSLFDGYTLGIKPPVRNSGDLKGSESIIIKGPHGQVQLTEGLICAARHIHMHPIDSIAFGVEDGDYVQVKVGGARGITFSNVLIRVSPFYKLEMHIDFDEANAANLKSGQLGELIGKEELIHVGGGYCCGTKC